ncbi:MAG: M20/M25/M40 family metallo-hydrolase [Chloroflexota bacterium]
MLAPASGLPVVILGPGEAGQAHQADEWVKVDALGEAARFYAALALRWLG